MAFKGGIKEAVKMLKGLDVETQKKLMTKMRMKDPEMAEKIELSMVNLEDLKFLTPSMLVGLLRDVKLSTFGLALRLVDKEVVNHILTQVSSGMRLDIEEGLIGPPKKVSEVQAAETLVLNLLKDKVDKGQIVINPLGDELV